jgi:hypothetical protein
VIATEVWQANLIALVSRVYVFGIVSSHWVLVDRELRPLAFKIQCVALATEIRGPIYIGTAG